MAADWTLGQTPSTPGRYVIMVGGTERLATWHGRWFDGAQVIDSRYVKGYFRLPDFPHDEP